MIGDAGHYPHVEQPEQLPAGSPAFRKRIRLSAIESLCRLYRRKVETSNSPKTASCRLDRCRHGGYPFETYGGGI